MGNDYTSVNILPVIGSEVTIEAGGSAVRGLPTHANLNKMNSRIDLSRKDLQNFLVNGSVQKEFIHTNKKELQKFIKNQMRSSSDYFRGYQSITSKQ